MPGLPQLGVVATAAAGLGPPTLHPEASGVEDWSARTLGWGTDRNPTGILKELWSQGCGFKATARY